MIWRCRNCAATWDAGSWHEGDTTVDFSIFWTRTRNGVEGGIVAVVHVPLRGMSVPKPCGPCDAMLDADELTVLSADYIKGHIRAALVRALPADHAERILGGLESMLRWGRSVDSINLLRLNAALEELELLVAPNVHVHRGDRAEEGRSPLRPRGHRPRHPEADERRRARSRPCGTSPGAARGDGARGDGADRRAVQRVQSCAWCERALDRFTEEGHEPAAAKLQP